MLLLSHHLSLLFRHSGQGIVSWGSDNTKVSQLCVASSDIIIQVPQEHGAYPAPLLAELISFDGILGLALQGVFLGKGKAGIAGKSPDRPTKLCRPDGLITVAIINHHPAV